MRTQAAEGASDTGPRGRCDAHVERSIDPSDPYEAIVVGTGFGGAVTICRLAQLGLRVLVLERGRRYDLASLPDLPKPGHGFPEPRRWTWQGSHGLWDLRNLDGVTVAQGAAYGGGSLVYANVHLRPPERVFDESWPEDCRGRTGLECDYDLVGYMLDIRPVPAPWQNTGKVKVMYEAFRDAARGVPPGGPASPPQSQHPADCNVFFPPLAIKFPVDPSSDPAPGPPPPEDTLPTNRFGAPQGECQRCGACDFGCRYGAKNTLDRNYLAAAEACRVDGEPVVTVRTLCEALYVSERKDECGYVVTYRDHLLGSVHDVAAKYLFLCAGSVNTTELLLRSTEHHRDRRARDKLAGLLDAQPGLGLGQPIRGLGRHYHVNADALAGVFDVPRPTLESAGPVITTALVYDGEAGADATPGMGDRGLTGTPEAPKAWPPLRQGVEPRSWFLIQDGGYPPAIAPLFSAFQSPLVLGRNRFDPDRLPWSPLTAVREPGGQRPDRYLSVLDGVAAALSAGEMPDVLPGGVREAWDALTQRVTGARDAELTKLVATVRDDVILNSWLFRWLKTHDVDVHYPALWRWTYELFVKLANIDDDTLLTTTLNSTRRRYGADASASLLRRAAGVVIGRPYSIDPPEDPFGRRPCSEPPPARHQAVLLAMGRDDMPAKLALGPDKRLVACFPNGGFPTLAEEERVMRAIADQLGGTLRSNPLWASARQPVTAHSHGGCALGCVTDAWGEVQGFPNLFINDGSLLPQPVGVNPSSTIAAVAERNIRHFALKLRQGRLPMAWKRDIVAARRWGDEQRQAHVALEPPAAHPIRLHHAAVGFAFAEQMRGHMMRLRPPDTMRLPTATERLPLAPFLRAEGDARRCDFDTGFCLTATVADVGAFLNDPARRIRLSGTIEFGAGVLSARRVKEKVAAGSLSLLVNLAPGRRLMIYELQFEHGGRKWTLLGEKEIRDDPGFDAWLDASTLYVELCEGWFERGDLVKRLISRERAAGMADATARGVLRLGLHDFAVNQLRNLRAVGTEDPMRVIWTLGSFGVFFFGQMQGAYAPEIERFLALLGRSSWRSTRVSRMRGDDMGALRFLEGL